MITIYAKTKLVDRLGQFPLSEEAVQFAWKQTKRCIRNLLSGHGPGGVPAERRLRNGWPVVTDGGPVIVNCCCGRVGNPAALATTVNTISGGVENGLSTRESVGMIVRRLDGMADLKA